METSPTPQRRSPGWGGYLIALALIILLIGLLWSIFAGDPPPPEASPGVIEHQQTPVMPPDGSTMPVTPPDPTGQTTPGGTRQPE